MNDGVFGVGELLKQDSSYGMVGGVGRMIQGSA